jgi:hypothetical protein
MVTVFRSRTADMEVSPPKLEGTINYTVPSAMKTGAQVFDFEQVLFVHLYQAARLAGVEASRRPSPKLCSRRSRRSCQENHSHQAVSI